MRETDAKKQTNVEGDTQKRNQRQGDRHHLGRCIDTTRQRQTQRSTCIQ